MSPLPGTTTTIVVTFFFGLFGLIPATIHANQATVRGRSGRRYWKAFWVTLLVQALLWISFWAAIDVWLYNLNV